MVFNSMFCIFFSRFRIIEATEGNIIIDENDISELPLKNLRSNLSIIPQDPVLFTGSLRFNLDPSEQIADEQMYSALELSQICDRNLDKEVLENGSNFSVGKFTIIFRMCIVLRDLF